MSYEVDRAGGLWGWGRGEVMGGGGGRVRSDMEKWNQKSQVA